MTATNVNLITSFIKGIVPKAQTQLLIANEITNTTFTLQREAFKETQRLESMGTSIEENPDFISQTTTKLLSRLERAKFEFLTGPDFVKLTDEDTTLLLIDASFDEIQEAIRQGSITTDDLQTLSNYYTSCTSMLLQRIETNVNEHGPEEPLKLFVTRARRCSDAATFLNCLIESVRQ